MRAISSLPVLPFIAVTLAAGVAVAVVASAYRSTPYAPGPQQIAVLGATKERGYRGAVFTHPETVVIYTTQQAARAQMATLCSVARRAGMEALTVRAVDHGNRTHIGSHHCNMAIPTY